MTIYKSHKTRNHIWFCGFLFFYFFTISSSAQTFVSLKPNITQTLIELGASDQIVGITKFCTKPNDKALRIADYQNIDVESLVRIKPDFIALSKENTQKKQFEQLDMAFRNTPTQIKVFEFNTLEEFFASYKGLAELLGKSQEAKLKIEKWQMLLSEVKAKTTNLSYKTFAIIVQREPLIVASGHTYLSSLLSEMGLHNVFANNQIAYPTLNPETLIGTHPDIIFDMSHHASDNPKFWGLAVIPIKIEDFLAHPQSIENAIELLTSSKLKF